jgi:hypothetical protein
VPDHRPATPSTALGHRLRRHAARLLLLAPLAAASAQAATAYAVSYFTLPDMAGTELWDIDNQGRLVGNAWRNADATDYRGFTVENGAVQWLTAPNGRAATGTAWSETGLLVGNHTDPTRTYTGINYVWDPITQTEVPQPFTAEVGVAFIRYPAGRWQSIDAPGVGINDTFSRATSPNGRYLLGRFYTGSETGQFVRDSLTGTTTALPAGANLFNGRAIDDNGRVIGSGAERVNGHGRAPVVYDPLTGQRTVLSNLGFEYLAPAAVNAKGQLAGWVQTQAGAGSRAWVGDGAGGITLLQTKHGTAVVLGMNDLGQVVGAWSNMDGSMNESFIATPVALPEAGGAPGSFSFSLDVRADQPVFLDPLVAVGYDYAVGTGDPLFKTVSLPVGIGDGRYTLHVGGLSLDVGGNQIVDFTALGFAQGVAGFRVTGIETAAMLDPADSSAFVTRLTFMADGRFTGTQTAISVDVPAVPEPAVWALWLGGLAVLLAWATQNRRHVQRQRGDPACNPS